MTRTTTARTTTRTSTALPRITPNPVEANMLRDMALVLRLTAKMSAEIRQDHEAKKLTPAQAV
ncbi:MAG: hypothetical protein ACRC8S_17885 [Fimbriiglobus sp.]|jgi:hypothetical protein